MYTQKRKYTQKESTLKSGNTLKPVYQFVHSITENNLYFIYNAEIAFVLFYNAEEVQLKKEVHSKSGSTLSNRQRAPGWVTSLWLKKAADPSPLRVAICEHIWKASQNKCFATIEKKVGFRWQNVKDARIFNILRSAASRQFELNELSLEKEEQGSLPKALVLQTCSRTTLRSLLPVQLLKLFCSC